MNAMTDSFADLGYWPLALFLAVFVGAAILVVRGGGQADRQRARRFAHRQEMDIGDFVRACGAGPPLDRAAVADLLKELAQAIGTTPGKLRPDDRFDAELSPLKGWEFGDQVAVTLENFLKEKHRVKSETEQDIHTIRDFLRSYCGQRATDEALS